MGQDNVKSTQSGIETNLISKVGSIISRERKQRQMTIAELAAKAAFPTGCSASLSAVWEILRRDPVATGAYAVDPDRYFFRDCQHATGRGHSPAYAPAPDA